MPNRPCHHHEPDEVGMARRAVLHSQPRLLFSTDSVRRVPRRYAWPCFTITIFYLLREISFFIFNRLLRGLAGYRSRPNCGLPLLR